MFSQNLVLTRYFNKKLQEMNHYHNLQPFFPHLEISGIFDSMTAYHHYPLPLLGSPHPDLLLSNGFLSPAVLASSNLP